MACYGDKGVEHLLKLLQVNNKNRIVIIYFIKRMLILNNMIRATYNSI